MNSKDSNERLYWIDVIRIVAIVLIILMHTPIPNVGTPGPILSTISFLTGPGIGLFFMISGVLLLGNNIDQTVFIKHRFSKVLYPTVFWTFIYIFNKCLTDSFSITDVLKSIISIPFSAQGHGVLWFMYTLAGLYLLTPILSSWLKSATRREIEFYLLLWAITLLYPFLKLILTINTETSGILYYFTGYCGYFLLGFYLKKYVISKGLSKWHIISCVVVITACIVLVFVSKRLKPDVEINVLFWYLSLPMALMSIAYFILLGRVPVLRWKEFVAKVSALSFGVYLVHILVMRSILWQIPVIHNSGAILHIPIVAILTTIISWLIAYGISKLPFSKYIIGV